MSRILLKLKEVERVPGDLPSTVHLEPLQPKSATPETKTIVKSIPVWGWMIVTLVLMVIWNAFWNALFFQPASAQAPSAEAIVSGSGDIHAVTDPPGAGILMDGNFVGVTPIRFDWEPGSHRLEIKKYGYHDLIVDLNLEKGRRMEVDLNLYPIIQQNLKMSETTPEETTKPTTSDSQTKPSAWVAKPGQGATPPRKVESHPENGDNKSTRIYTVEEENQQTITGRVQEMAHNEMPFRYSIQVGAFLDRDSALRLAAFWRRKGYDAYLLELYGIKDPSRLWQSVRIGRFDNIMVARRYMDNFRAKETADGYLALSDSFAPPSQGLLTAGIGSTSRKPIREEKEPNPASPAPPASESVTQTSPRTEEPNPSNGEENPIGAETIVPQSTPSLTQATPPKVQTPSPRTAPVAEQALVSATTAVSINPAQEDASIRWLNPSAPPPGPKMASTEPEQPKEPPATEAAAVPIPMETVKVDLEPTKSHLDLAPPNIPIAAKTTGERDNVPPPIQNPPAVGEKKSVASDAATNVTDSAEIQALYDQALAEEKNGNSSTAQELYKRVLERDSGHLLARQRLARIYVESGLAAQALTILKPAVSGRDAQSLAQSDPNFSAFLAALYQRQEEHQKAVELYKALLSSNPDKGIWQMGIAISLEKLHQPENAMANYEKALNSGELSARLRTFVQKRLQSLKTVINP